MLLFPVFFFWPSQLQDVEQIAFFNKALIMGSPREIEGSVLE